MRDFRRGAERTKRREKCRSGLFKKIIFFFFSSFFLLERKIVPVCYCCCIIPPALKNVVAAVMLSTLLRLGYFELGCHDPSLKYNNN